MLLFVKMAGKARLSQKELRLLESMAAGRSIEQAAKDCGLEIAPAYHLSRQRLFQQELALRTDENTQAVDRLYPRACAQALVLLCKQMADDMLAPVLRQSAAIAVLRLGGASHERAMLVLRSHALDAQEADDSDLE